MHQRKIEMPAAPLPASYGQKLLQVSQVLHNQAEAALLRQLAEDPQDTAALLRLGDLHRRKGDFRAASRTYERLCALRPSDRRVSWVHSITAGRQLPAERPQGLRAAPFVRIRDFLSHAERERLLSAALAMRGRFETGGTGRGADRKIKPLNRRALDAPLHPRSDLWAWFAPKLREALPKVSRLLRIDGLDQCRMGLSMVGHPDGGFSKKHRDMPIVLEALCYFHREPRPFSGGELLLYDTESETGSYSASECSRVEPANNSIVFFPGDYVHEVTPVACEPTDFTAMRFSMLATFEPKAA